jgi:hypothetical protein
MFGGRRMLRYVPELNRELREFAARVPDRVADQLGWGDRTPGWDVPPPAFLPFTAFPVADALGLAEEGARCREQWGFDTSLPLVATLDTPAGPRLEPLLAHDYRAFSTP